MAPALIGCTSPTFNGAWYSTQDIKRECIPPWTTRRHRRTRPSVAMLSTLIATSVAFALAHTVLAQDVQCLTYGATACPYTGPTLDDLESLISRFCGDNGGYPYYQYYEDLEATLPVEGYYQVTSGDPGRFSQNTCNSALNHIITECDATGEFWVTGIYETDGVTFSVTPCELA
ncbi:hypothetical protein DACRYDRAFT_116217 [Dacryopinax primogenitus]|uniref:Uncharacterized protein n=1 Tax=Dacryopinax primogenitus (strain DJM 731) TaxID=1858805 RepID=M5GCG4_DACPD|nr:uncharacterized protein DACRYDRAFT_116217 [Dacryopinax primogenitus]EJU01758.1 hypothetical protein DACRYDRAFT_116217 [Dacryopinax primogenitus]